MHRDWKSITTALATLACALLTTAANAATKTEAFE